MTSFYDTLYILYRLSKARGSSIFRQPTTSSEARGKKAKPTTLSDASGSRGIGNTVLRIGIYHLGQPMTKRSINLAPSRVKREA